MKRKTFRILAILWTIALIVGAIGIAFKFMTGERLAGYGSYVPWGLWIAIYFHAIGIAGGVYAIGIIGYFLNIPGLRENVRITLLVSFIGIIAALFSVWLDLGQMWNATRIMTSPNFGSMMAFNAWMYTVFFIVVGIAFALTYNKRGPNDVNDKSGWLAPLLMLGFIMSIAYPSQSGAFFGVVDAKPFWSSALLPILFLTSAMTSGAAVLLLVHTFLLREDAHVDIQPLKWLRWMVQLGVIAYFIAEFAEYSIVLWSPTSHEREAVNLVLFGPFWWVFWIFHLAAAVFALYLLLRGRSLPAVGSGAFIIAFTFIATRLNILIPGQAVSELRGLEEAFYHERLVHFYHPSLNEYMVAMFIGAVGVGAVYFGIQILSKFSSVTFGKHYEG